MKNSCRTVRLTRIPSEEGRLSYFPAPYRDECYYSVLCRYMVHSGIPSTRGTLKTLFGKDVSPGSALMMPFLSCRIPEWVNVETGITEEKVIREHTASGYFSIVYRKKEMETLLRRIRMGEKCGCRISYKGSFASSFLRYCPACACEEKLEYGEMYWHRMHQLEGVAFCIRHRMPLVESDVRIYDTKRRFIPASYALRDMYRKTLEECVGRFSSGSIKHEEKYGAIYRDIEWMMHNGAGTEGLDFIIPRYTSLLSARGWIVEDGGNVENVSLLKNDITQFFGKDFLDDLHLKVHEYLEWESIPPVVAKYMTPLQHVLMMEYLSGSAKKFFEDEAG